MKTSLAGLALVICTGTLHANALTAAAATVVTALTCNTSGPVAGSATIKITAANASAVAPVTVGISPTAASQSGPPVVVGGTINSGGYAVLTASSNTATYTIVPTAGCPGLASGANASVPVQFLSSVGSSSTAVAVPTSTDATGTVSITVTAAATSPLTVSPSAITLYCTLNAGTYTGGSQTFNVTSSAVGGGTPVTVDAAYKPNWITILPTGQSSMTYPNNAVGATPVSFTASVSPGGCSGPVGSTQSATLHLLNLPATAYKTLAVTMQVVAPSGLGLSGASPVSTSPNVYAISYTKNQSTPAVLNLSVTGSVYFSVNTALLPNWLTVNTAGGEATSGGFPLQFMVTKVADTMTPGVYPTVFLHLTVPGQADTVFGVTLTVANALPVLSVAEGTARNLTWTVGTPLPTPTITALSNGSPIAIAMSASKPSSNGTIPVLPNGTTGLAFSFGTSIAVAFNSSDFAAVQPGTTLTGMVTLSCASEACANTASVVVTFAVTVQTATINAVLTGLSPTNLPTAVSGQTFTVTLYGAGFVFNSGSTQNTNVGVVSSGALLTVPDPNIAVNVLNSSTIVLTITVPATDKYLTFAAPGGTVTFGVCNPFGAPSCSTPTGTVTLTTGAGPIIQTNGVTSASTFAPVTPGTGIVAPYDILSIFGSNFCSSGGSGCSGAQVLYPTLINNQSYGTSLSPDGGTRNLTVTFYTPTGQTATGGLAAPLLFATNNQINVIVPGALQVGTQYDIVVKFGATGGFLSSVPYTVTAAATDPGVFVIDPATNEGAVELASGVIVDSTASNAGRMRATQTNSDVVEIYMTGLGLPNSTAADTAGGGVVFTDCLSPANYKTAAGLSTLDGAVIQPSLIASGRYAPCFNPGTSGTPLITATVGGQPAGATVQYAGWVEGAVAGLYQVNVQLPANGLSLSHMDGSSAAIPAAGSAPVQVPVVVTLPGGASQSKVGVWVQPAATIVATSGGIYSQLATALSGAATTPVLLDTLTNVGMTGTLTYTLTAVSGSDTVTGRAAQTSDFTLGATSGVLNVVTALQAGVYRLTVTLSDTGSSKSGYPLETIVLTLTVS